MAGSPALSTQPTERLPGTQRRRAPLTMGELHAGHWREVWLPGVDLEAADLRGARLRGADLTDANLQRADLRHADLRSATLAGADLRGADLRGADLHEADLTAAWYDGGTAWPHGFRPEAHHALTRVEADWRPRKRIRFDPMWLCALGVPAADQALKALARGGAAHGAALIPGLLSLTFTRNGGSFPEMLPGAGLVLTGAPALVLLGVGLWLVRSLARSRLSGASLIGALLLLAGGLSNGLDRLLSGGVIDCLAVPPGIVFNLADVAITAGLILLGRYGVGVGVPVVASREEEAVLEHAAAA